MSYESIQALCGTAGLVIFFGIFAIAVAWVFRPGSSEYYKKMSQMPLREE